MSNAKVAPKKTSNSLDSSNSWIPRQLAAGFFIQLSLILHYNLTNQCIQLHDVVRTYLEEQVVSKLPSLHGLFLDAYNIQDEPVEAAKDPYLCRYLTYHLVKAERWEELKNLLLDVDWLYAKLNAVDVPAVLSDFDWIKNEQTFNLVQGAIRLSAHIVGKDSKQLVGQLLGRLQNNFFPEVQKLIQQGKEWKKSPWLRLLQGNLIPPGGPLIRTLSGHRGGVYAVALTADGTRAISASHDQSCIVWDLATGQELHALRGHRGPVMAVAVTSDGMRAISASYDQTCIVWDLATGKELQTLRGHRGEVIAVAVTVDGTRAISASDDQTCKVWDLGTGQELHTLRGHSGGVTAVAVTADGTRAISASNDQTCKVWDLGTGQELYTLPGHSGGVTAVALTVDGMRAVLASDDWTCKVWELTSMKEVATFIGESVISSCAVSPDSKTIIVGERAGRIHILRLEGVE